jgi:hypothetical protein
VNVINSNIGLRSIHFVGEATALFPRSTPTTGSFIFHEDQQRVKLEGSSFKGTEPDEFRYGFDKPLFNSWSGRLSYNPSRNWALPFSSLNTNKGLIHFSGGTAKRKTFFLFLHTK